tara:strand:+ start:143 stop:943 length:801 start_codon:yes stop_codon:yes gene_type:complete
MPEGPECRLTVEYLNRVLCGKKILDWVFCGGQYVEKDPIGFPEFDKSLPLLVKNISCKGKFIYFILVDDNDQEYYILHSLMMTGRWQNNHDKYCKWFLELNNKKTLWFRSPRSFSTVLFTSDKSVLQNKLDKLGPDIMGREFFLPNFKLLCQKYSKRNITSFLMDQQVISGCGNYIKAEVLWYASISPLRKVKSLTNEEIELLYEGLRIIPRLSYNRKGLSIRDYKNENNEPGEYSSSLKVYGNKSVTRTKTPDGRITYWDPTRQI